MLTRFSLLTLIIVLAATPLFAQTAAGTPVRLRVFLDCGNCYQDYLRDQIKWVDFVRQAQDADVHLLDNSNETGGGGREVLLRFVGNNRFKGVDRELRVVTVAGDPDAIQRDPALRTVSIGLLEVHRA